MHEVQMHDENCAITLTYSDENLTTSLIYKDFQDFMKRLRKYLGGRTVRFFMCGEYGDKLGRPHFHAMLFGYGFYEDRISHGKSISGIPLYTSATLTKVWSKGHAVIQDATKEMAAYIARYCTKKLNGDKERERHEMFDVFTGEIISRVPEFGRMSLKPGIGLSWIDRFSSDITNTNKLVVNAREHRIPRYYKKYLELNKPAEYDSLKQSLRKRAYEKPLIEQTIVRMEARKACALAKFKKKVREYEA